MTITLRSELAIRRTVLAIGATGAVLFALLFATSWLFPTVLETWARKAIAHKVQQRVETHLEGLHDSAIGKVAARMIEKNNQQKRQARQQMAKELPSASAVAIEAVIGRMLNPACSCRNPINQPGKMAELVKRAKQSENADLQAAIGKLDETNATLTGLIESKYRDVAQSLLGEVRIFSAANGTVFLLLMLTARLWKRSALQLLAPAAVLLGAAALTATVYLVDQNWLQTILMNDYVGLAYFPYLAACRT